ncbi:hypothetical protein ABEY65_23045 [Priestia aryabhattai]|nr:hypothetical protein [Priestia aryabhattai]
MDNIIKNIKLFEENHFNSKERQTVILRMQLHDEEDNEETNSK